jgi:hypothetical protein
LFTTRRRCATNGEEAMSSYRFLQDHSVGGIYYQAGTIASTVDVGGTLPVNWPPTGACDPLDAPAVAAFYQMGPQLGALIRQQWVGLPVTAGVTRWVVNPQPTLPGNPGREYVLTGLGSGLPFAPLAVNASGFGGVYP